MRLPRAPAMCRAFGSLPGSGSPTALDQMVGNTPLVRLKSASDASGCNIFGKAEWAQPGGSVKDRAAYWMIKDAEERGELVPGEPGTIVEGTAGNTGIGLATVGMTKGYRVLICIGRNQAQEKKDALRWAGAELVEVDAVPYTDPNNYVHVAKRLADNLKSAGGERVFYANQWDNLANRRAHTESTGPEIYRQTDGKVDAFSCAMGTGGTLTGVAQYLRSQNKDIKIALTDPCGAKLYRYYRDGVMEAEGSSISEGIGQGRLTGNMEGFRPDLQFEIDDTEMMSALHDIQRGDGLCLGTSSGINVAGAMRVAKELGPGSTVVTILCDLGNRYATKIFNIPFLESKNYPTPKWVTPPEDPAVKDAVERALKEF